MSAPSLQTQLKKRMTHLTKIKIKGWRTGKMAHVGGVERRNKQIGQLLYYLVAVQLKRVQQYLSPLKKPSEMAPTDVLGLFLEQEEVCFYLSLVNSSCLAAAR